MWKWHPQLPCDGTAAGPVTSEEPLCIQRAEREQSSGAFSSPWPEEIFYQLWWETLDGLSEFCSCLQVQ